LVLVGSWFYNHISNSSSYHILFIYYIRSECQFICRCINVFILLIQFKFFFQGKCIEFIIFFNHIIVKSNVTFFTSLFFFVPLSLDIFCGHQNSSISHLSATFDFNIIVLNIHNSDYFIYFVFFIINFITTNLYFLANDYFKYNK